MKVQKLNIQIILHRQLVILFEFVEPDLIQYVMMEQDILENAVLNIVVIVLEDEYYNYISKN